MNAPKKTDVPSEETTEDDEPKFAEFEYKGNTYKVPSDPKDVPLEVVYAESEYEMIEEIVGPDQWLEFRKTRPTIRDFGKFSELVFEAAGYSEADAGN
ncbi:hypothetical protein [Streptomyces sp. NPDC006355]|uniref:hypothetical protein n=1 Tax=Streptomyces sp. NPDC006355 TaxID=3156758 RepID=UPI0033BB218F